MLKKILRTSNSQSTTSRDLGFGTRSFKNIARLITKDGDYNIKNKQRFRDFNAYHWLINMSWITYFLVIIALFIGTNLFFALVYYWCGVNQLTSIEVNNGWDELLYCLYFSTQTLTSVGYGYISPVSHAVNLVAALEATIGLAGFAFVTGISYGRFSKAKAKILFSQNIIMAPFNDGKGMMFRVVNSRRNKLIEMKALVILSYLDPELDKRLYKRLELQIEQISLFPLPWTIVHPLNQDSPLHETSASDLKRMDAEIIITLNGFDETFNQQVHQIHSYKYFEFVFNASFQPMYETNKTTGQVIIDFDRLGNFKKL